MAACSFQGVVCAIFAKNIYVCKMSNANGPFKNQIKIYFGFYCIGLNNVFSIDFLKSKVIDFV